MIPWASPIPNSNGIFIDSANFAQLTALSQGSVVTRSRCGGIFYYHFARHLLLSLLVKEFS